LVRQDGFRNNARPNNSPETGFSLIWRAARPRV
jgi:hypothetical protein